jgi:histidyl-tRNA synthetase
MKKADASGAPLALIVGDDEAAADAVGVKPLRAPGGPAEQPGAVANLPATQVRVNFDRLADHLGELLFTVEDNDGNF